MTDLSSLEMIFYGLLAVLVLAFILDVAGRRRSLPRPQRFELEHKAPEQQVAPVAEKAPVPAAPVEAEPQAAPEVAVPVEAPRSLLERVKEGLSRTRANFTDGLSSLFLGRRQIDKALLEEIE